MTFIQYTHDANIRGVSNHNVVGNQTLDIGILPGCARGGFHLLNSETWLKFVPIESDTHAGVPGAIAKWLSTTNGQGVLINRKSMYFDFVGVGTGFMCCSAVSNQKRNRILDRIFITNTIRTSCKFELKRSLRFYDQPASTTSV